MNGEVPAMSGTKCQLLKQGIIANVHIYLDQEQNSCHQQKLNHCPLGPSQSVILQAIMNANMLTYQVSGAGLCTTCVRDELHKS